MQGKKFIFFLRNKATNTFYQVVNGAVMTGAPEPLQYSPAGWQATSLVNERNTTYFALDRSFGVDMEFVEDGAQILRHIFYNFGSELEVEFIIGMEELYLDNAEYGFYYKFLYSGDVDFSTFLHDGPKVKVSIMEGGVLRYIKANQNTKYEFPIDVPEAIKVKHTGMKLFKKGNFQVVDGLEIAKSVYGGNILLPVIHLQDEGLSTGLAFLDQEIKGVAGLSFADKIADDDVFVLGTDDITGITPPLAQPNLLATVEGVLKFKITKNNGFGISFRFLTSELTLVTQDLYRIASGSTNQPVGTKIELPFSFQIPIRPKTKLKLEAIIGGATGAVDYAVSFEQGNKIQVSYSNIFKTTYYKSLPPEYLFQQIIQKLSDGKYTLDSTILTENFNLTVTSGDGLRGLDKPVIKTSLADAFQSYGVPLNIGMGVIAGALRLEDKKYFVDYSDPIILGEGSKPKMRCASDRYFNTIKYGYPNQTYDVALGATNGRFEFNTTRFYTTPITTKAKEYNGVSVYRADCFGAEGTRINFENKTTSDSSSDNDVFFIHVKKEPVFDPVEGYVYELNRDLNPYVTGVPDPATVFNVWLAPGLALKRVGSFIRSHFYKQDNKNLVYQTTDKNPDLKLTFPAGTVHVESANIELSNLDDPLFRPVMIDVDIPIDFSAFEILDQNPVKSFQFSIDGVIYIGLPVKVSVDPYTADKQTFSLLSAPANDLTPLIDFYE